MGGINGDPQHRGQQNEEEGWDGWQKCRGLTTGIWGKAVLGNAAA